MAIARYASASAFSGSSKSDSSSRESGEWKRAIFAPSSSASRLYGTSDRSSASRVSLVMTKTSSVSSTL